MSQLRSGGGGRGRKRGQAPTVRPFLPPELLRFLGRHSYSLLVKGEAATGKTILALSILRAVDTGNNYLYLSTRVSPSQLFENHPWLTDFAASGTVGGGSRRDGESGGGRGGEREKGGGGGDGAGPSQLEPERFVDARLDEPVPFFERITNELMDARSPTIVVDAWDPIGIMMGDDASLSNAKVLQTWRERADAKIVVLMEDSSDSKFDSLFDGVVSLDKYYDDGRIIRMIQLSKLSGVKINRPSCIFTLDGGVFQSFTPGNPLDFDRKSSAGWSWERRARRTGYRALDAILDGSLPPGTIINLELSPAVNSGTALLFLSGILDGLDSRSRALLFKPFEGIGVERASNALGELVPIQSGSRRNDDGADGWDSLKSQVQKQKADQQERKIVTLIGAEFLSRAGGDDDRERLFEFMKSRIDLSIVVSRSETTFENAASVSDIALKLAEIDGTPVVQPQIPWTEYFAISIRVSNKRPKVSIVPIV
jgi:GvpD gas vesicle protein